MARLSTYTKDVNLTGKDMLAGSNYVATVNGIDQFETNNFTLKKVTEYINGQIVTDPSIISLKTNGGLVYETVNETNFLAVDLSATNITGQLANSDLVNSSITINGTSVALGGSITIGEVSEVIAGTYLNGGGTEGTITLNHDNTTRIDTTSSISPAHESSFTVIDTLSTNATGHVTDVNTKTITLPADTTYTIEAIDSSNDALIRLIGSDSSIDDIKLKAGANININVNESTDEIEIVGTAFGNVYTVNSEAAMIAATSTAGDLVVRTDVSKTFIHNGGTTGTVTDFTELQFSGIQQIDLVEGEGIALEDHASNPITSLTQGNNDLKVINTLATASERGGIQIGYTENGKNYPVELGPNPGDEKAYVNVPWTDTTYTNGPGLDLVGTEFSHTDTSSQASVNNFGRTYIQDITLDTFGHVTGLTSATETVTDTNNYVTTANVTGSTTKTLTLTRQGLSDLTAQWTDIDTVYVLPLAANGTRGGVQIGYSENGKNYPVELSGEKMFVNVPWTDTVYSLPLAANGTRGGVQVGYVENGRNYPVELSSEKMFVNVPWTDNNTTNWNFRADSNVAENISAGETLTFASGTNVSIGQSGNTLTINSTNTIPNNGLLDINQGSGISLAITGGDFSADKASTTTIEISHADTSSQASINNFGRTYIQDITLDTYGHITGITSATETYQYTHPSHPGDDIDLDTGPLSAGTVISDLDFNITTDTLGHVTDANASYQIYNLDNRYYTETEIGNFFSGATGITGYNKSNWDTAYSWGNHATQGYITDGNTNWDNIYGFITDGNTNWDNTYGFITASSTDTLTNKSGNISQWTNNSGYLTSLAGSTGGTLRVNGSGAWLTAEGNVQSTNPPMGQGLAFGWNRSGGSRESEILFHGGTSTHSDGELYIRSWNGSSYVSVAKFEGTGNTNFSGNINAENTGSSYIRKAYDSSRYAQLESNSSGGALNLTHTSSTRVLLRSYDDCYFVNAGQVGFGTTTPTYPVHVTDEVDNTSIYALYDIVAYSDERVKEDIQVIPNALEKVSNIRGVTFKRKDANNENRMAGVIAQEIEKVLPEVVKEDKDGNKAVAYGNVVSLLIEAIKELSDKVKVLENGSTE